MTAEFKKILDEIYFYAGEAQHEDIKEAETAFIAGNMPVYFDLNINIQLADVCWALEKWDEAKQWYEHNAQLMMKRRMWHLKFSEPDYPLDINADWEAATLVKAGHHNSATESIEKALSYWALQPSSQEIIIQLALHAAQIGLKNLAENTILNLKDNNGNAVNELELQFVKLEILLLMQQWTEFHDSLKPFQEAVRQYRNKDLSDDSILQSLFEVSSGFDALDSLRVSPMDDKTLVEKAKFSFENAMFHFYNYTGYVGGYVYFMRLNARIAEEYWGKKVLQNTLSIK